MYGQWDSDHCFKSNKFSSAMTMCKNSFHNGFKTCMLQIGESTIHRIVVAWVVFMEAIISCLILNLMIDV